MVIFERCRDENSNIRIKDEMKIYIRWQARDTLRKTSNDLASDWLEHVARVYQPITKLVRKCSELNWAGHRHYGGLGQKIVEADLISAVG